MAIRVRIGNSFTKLQAAYLKTSQGIRVSIWLEQTCRARYLAGGPPFYEDDYLEFDREEDYTMFMLKWSS
jgi:hypothetical protein